ncbi:MAG: hypothetical protein K0S09_341 [Sphingobacteriaceae bacterium]|jgi:maltose/maltodextrin transport system substrate-binding protein|nr:hypothetical protein [Sphingobacteriaceae bacterium]
MSTSSFFSINWLKNLGTGLLLICNLQARTQSVKMTAFGNQALQETVVPVRPGIPGLQPFWNQSSHQFIYAPAFNYKAVNGATFYRFELLSLVDSSRYKFESGVPYAPLSPVWADVPVGYFNLKAMAVGADGKELGTAGEGKYYRAAYFNGIYHSPVMAYDKSAMTALNNLLNKDFVNYWFEHKSNDPGYEYYRYPAKIWSALIIGAVTQARLKANTPEASRYTQLAKIVADYLISVSFKPGTPLEYHPPTYRGYEDIFKKVTPHIKTDSHLMIQSADAGNAYLDLYDLTADKKYLEAAKRIASTYLKTQLPNGSWYMFINVNTGKPAAPNIAIPTSTINYFDRLSRDYKVPGLEDATKRAVKWMMENPIKTYDWQGMFEDIGPRAAYSNHSREQVCDMAVYLLKNAKSDPRNLPLAEDLIRFAEDQFVIWEKPVAAKKNKIPKGDAWNSVNWITPGVQEQYTFWEPVGRTAGIMMETYRTAYNVTGKDIYLAKAKSIANTFTVVQSHHNGDYPTLFSKFKSNFWLNSVVYPAKMMMLLENDLKSQKH